MHHPRVSWTRLAMTMRAIYTRPQHHAHSFPKIHSQGSGIFSAVQCLVACARGVAFSGSPRCARRVVHAGRCQARSCWRQRPAIRTRSSRNFLRIVPRECATCRYHVRCNFGRACGIRFCIAPIFHGSASFSRVRCRVLLLRSSFLPDLT